MLARIAATYSRHSALFRNIFALALTALAFFLLDTEFASGFAPEFRVSAFWFTTATLSIYLCGAALLTTLFRIARDLFFAVLTWCYTWKERRADNV